MPNDVSLVRKSQITNENSDRTEKNVFEQIAKSVIKLLEVVSDHFPSN